MDCSMPDLPVHLQLLEFTQIHVHWVTNAIQPTHPLSAPSSSRLQSFSASGSFPMSQLFTSGCQSVGVSASTSVLPMNIQDWFPLGCTGWISLLSKGLSRVFSNTTVQKHQFFGAQPSFWRIGFLSLADKAVKIKWGHWLASSWLIFWQPHGLRGRCGARAWLVSPQSVGSGSAPRRSLPSACHGRLEADKVFQNF